MQYTLMPLISKLTWKSRILKVVYDNLTQNIRNDSIKVVDFKQKIRNIQWQWQQLEGNM